MKNLKYFIYFGLMLLTANITILNGIKPFDTGIFVGLVFAGENLAYLAPIYLVTSLITNPSLNTLILTASTITFVAILYLISTKLKKRVNLIEINIAVILARIPTIILNSQNLVKLTDSLFTLILAQVFCLICMISLFAIVKRGYLAPMTSDEKVSSSIIIAILSLGLFQLNIFGFKPYYLIIPFITCMLVINSGFMSIYFATLFGIGASFSTGNIALAAAVPFCAIFAMMFKKGPSLLIVGGYILADIALGFYFDAFADFNLLHIIAVVIGCLVILFISPNQHEKLKLKLNDIKKGLAARAVINMTRFELSSQIASVGKAFNDIELAIKKDIDYLPSPARYMEDFKTNMAKNVCSQCPYNNECYKEDDDSVVDMFEPILTAAIDKGRATVLDVPHLLTSICKNVSDLTKEASNLIKIYNEKVEKTKKNDSAKLLLAEQSAGISLLMNNLAKKTSRSIVADDRNELKLIEELAYRNVVCSEVLNWSNEDRGITLIVRNKDKDKKIIDKILYSRTGICWSRGDIKCDHTNGMTAITFYPAPNFELLSGECMATKEGSIVSGDTRSITRISQDKVIIALSDGMGSGEQAELDSSSSLAMIENLYCAGFDSDTILTLANSLLTSSHEDRFTALDLAIVDLQTGFTDFIKLGGVDSYIRSEEGIEIIEGGALPLGIVEEMSPLIKRRKINTKELCLIISDGVTDTIKEQKLQSILVNNSTLNPQVVSSEIVKACLAKGVKDDITAIAFRIYRKV